MAYSNAGINLLLQDESFTGIDQLAGYALVQAITERGEPNKAHIVNNEQDFKRQLGTPIHASGKEIMRGLSLGAKFIVFPVHDYTDVTDTSTIVGTLATGDIGTVTFKGKTVGPGYNGVVITTAAALSNEAGKIDIFVTLGSLVSEKKENVPALLTEETIAEINNALTLVNIPANEVGSTLTVGTVTLSGGARDISLINNADIIGSATNNTGIYAFDKSPLDTMRIINVIKQDTAIDAAYVTYAEKTLRTVHAYTVAGANQTTTLAYEAAAPKSMHYRLTAGGVSIPDPNNKAVYFASIGAGDHFAAIAKKDAEGVHFSTAEDRFCNFNPEAKDVLVNFYGNTAIEAKAINIIANDAGRVRYFGNKNTQANRSSILCAEDVSDFVIALMRQLLVVAKRFQFKKNNRQELWSPIYRSVRTLMEAWVLAGAVQGEEGIGWTWNGDQDANNLTELTFNTPSQISAGVFNAQLVVIPVRSAEIITIATRVQSGASVSVALV